MTRKIDDLFGVPQTRPDQAMGVPDPRVGHDGPPRCGAKKRDGSGELCGQAAGWGTSHPGTGRCKLHLGSTAKQEAAARQVTVAVEAMKLAPHFERHEDPADVLISSLRHARALAAYFEDLIRRGTAPLHTVAAGGERKPSVEVLMWQAERDRADKVAATCIRLGLDERRVRVAEGMGDAMFAAIDAAFRTADVDMGSDRGRAAFESAAVAFERSLGMQADRGIAQIEQHLGEQA